MSRYSNENLVYVGSPFCAPDPFVVTEETICVLRRLYQEDHWRSEITRIFADVCKEIEEASNNDLKVSINSWDQ